ncbi:MAG TPA: cell division protein SepF [Acidimicrobiales bacterium]|nr:cell division protein SepF [Acidimicrobiales bacterium]
MTTFMQKALQYLGLKDIEDEEYYDDEEMMEPAPTPGRTVYPEASPETTASGTVATVRPLVREERAVEPTRQSAVVRPLVSQRHTKPQVVAPQRFSDAQEIGDLVKASHPVIVNLQASERDLARRMIDFCSGLTYAVSGTMEKVAEQVFLLTPSNVEVSQEERQRLSERGLFRS